MACRGRGSPGRWDWGRPRRRSSGSAGSPAAPGTRRLRDVAYVSAPEDLALHGVRVLGFATASRIAGRYGLDAGTVGESLLDFEACGWARDLSFADTSGWSLTDAGRGENERRLAAELDAAGVRDAVTTAHAAFMPLNRRSGTCAISSPDAWNASADTPAGTHPRWARWRRGSSPGSTPPTGTRVTWCGSSSMKTCWPRSEYRGARIPDTPGPRPPRWVPAS